MNRRALIALGLSLILGFPTIPGNAAVNFFPTTQNRESFSAQALTAPDVAAFHSSTEPQVSIYIAAAASKWLQRTFYHRLGWSETSYRLLWSGPLSALFATSIGAIIYKLSDGYGPLPPAAAAASLLALEFMDLRQTSPVQIAQRSLATGGLIAIASLPAIILDFTPESLIASLVLFLALHHPVNLLLYQFQQFQRDADILLERLPSDDRPSGFRRWVVFMTSVFPGWQRQAFRVIYARALAERLAIRHMTVFQSLHLSRAQATSFLALYLLDDEGALSRRVATSPLLRGVFDTIHADIFEHRPPPSILAITAMLEPLGSTAITPVVFYASLILHAGTVGIIALWGSYYLLPIVFLALMVSLAILSVLAGILPAMESQVSQLGSPEKALVPKAANSLQLSFSHAFHRGIVLTALALVFFFFLPSTWYELETYEEKRVTSEHGGTGTLTYLAEPSERPGPHVESKQEETPPVPPDHSLYNPQPPRESPKIPSDPSAESAPAEPRLKVLEWIGDYNYSRSDAPGSYGLIFSKGIMVDGMTQRTITYSHDPFVLSHWHFTGYDSGYTEINWGIPVDLRTFRSFILHIDKADPGQIEISVITPSEDLMRSLYTPILTKKTPDLLTGPQKENPRGSQTIEVPVTPELIQKAGEKFVGIAVRILPLPGKRIPRIFIKDVEPVVDDSQVGDPVRDLDRYLHPRRRHGGPRMIQDEPIRYAPPPSPRHKETLSAA